MKFVDPSAVLWENICSLMGYGPGAKHGRIAQMTARPIYGESTEYVFACVN